MCLLREPLSQSGGAGIFCRMATGPPFHLDRMAASGPSRQECARCLRPRQAGLTQAGPDGNDRHIGGRIDDAHACGPQSVSFWNPLRLALVTKFASNAQLACASGRPLPPLRPSDRRNGGTGKRADAG